MNRRISHKKVSSNTDVRSIEIKINKLYEEMNEISTNIKQSESTLSELKLRSDNNDKMNEDMGKMAKHIFIAVLTSIVPMIVFLFVLKLIIFIYGFSTLTTTEQITSIGYLVLFLLVLVIIIFGIIRIKRDHKKNYIHYLNWLSLAAILIGVLNGIAVMIMNLSSLIK